VRVRLEYDPPKRIVDGVEQAKRHRRSGMAQRLARCTTVVQQWRCKTSNGLAGLTHGARSMGCQRSGSLSRPRSTAAQLGTARARAPRQ